MAEQEKLHMQEHARYMQEAFQAGKLLLYGPVMASDGSFGLGVLEVEDEAAARRFGENDPTVVAGLNKFQIHPMRVAAARGKAE